MNSSLPWAKKSLGQHWLSDPATLEAICDLAEIKPNDTVLEIGPGSGTLTKHLVKKAKHVVAVEFDRELARKLSAKSIQNLEIREGDILKFDLTSLPSDYKIVANIPYYLTGKLLRILSESDNQALIAVLLLQKEVAQRLAATPGKMSLLSVSAQYYWTVELGLEVPAKLFTPPPKIDSQAAILKRPAEPPFPEVDAKLFFRIVKAGFSAKRKTLLNTMSAGLGIQKDDLTKIFKSCDISPNSRAQMLSLEQWHLLYKAIKSH